MNDAACSIDELSYCCCAISFEGSGAGTFDTLEKRGLAAGWTGCTSRTAVPATPCSRSTRSPSWTRNR